LAEMDASSAFEPLVGREAELEHVLSVLRAVASGPGRLVLLRGEPGIGKTRLAREVLQRARAAGHIALAGRCFEQQTAVPFFPFMELLEAALDHAPSSLKAEAPRRWPELAYLLPEFVAATPKKLDGAEAQLRVFRAATGFLRALAEASPSVLLLDDLHWADSTSLALLLFLGSPRQLAASRLLVVGTYRDVEVNREHPLEATMRELARYKSGRPTAAVRCCRTDAASVIEALYERLPEPDPSPRLLRGGLPPSHRRSLRPFPKAAWCLLY
jgi:predicted ATPase